MPGRSTRDLVTERFAVLSDMTRLRLLRLLEREELTVSELAAILQMPQSTVSRHLKVLLEGRWIVRRSEGTTSWYRVAAESLQPEAARLWEVAREQLGEPPQVRQDQARLSHVLLEREADASSYFGRVGGEWDAIRDQLYGPAFTERALLALLPGEWVVADLGCGTGNVSALLAPHVAKVHAVDVSEAMLEAARKRLAAHPNVQFHRGDLTALPLKDASVDAAVLSLVLHHVEEPVNALRDAARVLRPGGRIAVIDMVEHGREEYRHTMGHRWLGFSARQMTRWLSQAAFEGARVTLLPVRAEARGPELFVASARVSVS